MSANYTGGSVAPSDRPVPIRDAFKSVGSAIGFAGSVLVSLVGYGVIDQAQADATTNLLGLIPGAITAVTAVLMAFGVRASAEPKVTALADPRNDAGQPLTPDVTPAPVERTTMADKPRGVVTDGDTWTS